MATRTTRGGEMHLQRYREAERRLWEYAGVTPTERRVRLVRNGVTVRIQVVGEGPPALFIHGAPNSGSTWAPLVGKLRRIRCWIVDCPGTGLSDPLRLDWKTAPGFADSFVADVLDALEISRAHLVVSSLGGYIGLRSAAGHPERVERVVQMGCPAFVPGMPAPSFMRFLMFPGARHLMNMLPPSHRANRIMFRQIGHGASLDAGRIPQVFFDWYLALARDTDTMRNGAAMIARFGSIRGFDPSLTLTSETLGSVTAPTRFLIGEAEPIEVVRAAAALMPNADLEILARGGHLPWLDDPDHAAKVTESFLLG